MFTQTQLDVGINYALFHLWSGDNIDTAVESASKQVSYDTTEQFHFQQWAKCEPRVIEAAKWYASKARL